MMEKKNQAYQIGEVIKGLDYKNIGHCENGILWWIFHGKFRKHTSKASVTDCHVFQVRQKDKISADEVYRGRYFAGVATILPPISVYSKPVIRLPPKRILNMVYTNLKPKVLLLSTPCGLYRIVKNT